MPGTSELCRQTLQLLLLGCILPAKQNHTHVSPCLHPQESNPTLTFCTSLA